MATPRRKEMIGRQFGELKVLAFYEKRSKHRLIWECLCSCGTICYRDGSNMRNHMTKTCGVGVHAFNRKHGMTFSRTYNSWIAMKHRCYQPNTKEYKNYGGRGIRVCERWRHSFENFLEDMGERPEGMSIDRINSNGNYEPKNCRWASWKTQRLNQRPRNVERNKFWDRLKSRGYSYSQVAYLVNEKTYQTVISGIRANTLNKVKEIT